MTTRRIPTQKRIFDVIMCVLVLPLWVPVVLLCSLAILATEGLPIFYSSQRRVFRNHARRVVKFRTMINGADKIANRETVPMEQTRFLNIPADSPLYTRVGRFIERYHFTELPQLVHVLSGSMSLVGNRPLPENVIRALREEYPWAECRFLTSAGLTGPAQLIGRDAISDEDRLDLEVTYCVACFSTYSFLLDSLILLFTVLVALRIRRPFTVTEVQAFLKTHSGWVAVSDDLLQTFHAHARGHMKRDADINPIALPSSDLASFGVRAWRRWRS